MKWQDKELKCSPISRSLSLHNFIIEFIITFGYTISFSIPMFGHRIECIYSISSDIFWNLLWQKPIHISGEHHPKTRDANATAYCNIVCAYCIYQFDTSVRHCLISISISNSMLFGVLLYVSACQQFRLRNSLYQKWVNRNAQTWMIFELVGADLVVIQTDVQDTFLFITLYHTSGTYGIGWRNRASTIVILSL